MAGTAAQVFTLTALFEQFLADKRFGEGVSATTVRWYRSGWELFGLRSSSFSTDLRQPLAERAAKEIELEVFLEHRAATVARQRQTGTVNSYGVSVNSFLHWLWKEGHLISRMRFPTVPVARRLPIAFSIEDVKKLVRFVPQEIANARIRVVALLTLDCGIGLEEALNLTREDVNGQTEHQGALHVSDRS